jgi:hypothetical protein
MTSAVDHFRAVAPQWMGLLRADFPQLGPNDAAAVFGNFGHESKGLTDDQEDNPTVKGSRGGRNWAQWTGARRRALEAYCARTGRDPDSDEAAYAFLFVELKTTEKHAIAALLAAKTLEDKVVAFEKAFLRAGIKHYSSRQQWAKIALEAYRAAGSPMATKDVKGATPPVPKPPIVRPEAAAGGATLGLGAVVLAALLALPLWAWLLIGATSIAGILAWPKRHAIATHIRLALGKL